MVLINRFHISIRVSLSQVNDRTTQTFYSQGERNKIDRPKYTCIKIFILYHSSLKGLIIMLQLRYQILLCLLHFVFCLVLVNLSLFFTTVFCDAYALLSCACSEASDLSTYHHYHHQRGMTTVVHALESLERWGAYRSPASLSPAPDFLITGKKRFLCHKSKAINLIPSQS